MDIDVIEKKLDKLFVDAIDINDTMWCSKYETLFCAILNMIEQEMATDEATIT